MAEYAIEYPGYGWERNRGYPTPDHRRALRELGATPLHRRTFGLVRQIVSAADEPELVFEQIESFESHPPAVESQPAVVTQDIVESAQTGA